MNFISM